MATIEVAENIENLKLKKTGNVIFQDAGMWDKLDRIQQRFDYACESLERETYAAGTVLEPILKPLLAYMRGVQNVMLNVLQGIDKRDIIVTHCNSMLQ